MIRIDKIKRNNFGLVVFRLNSNKLLNLSYIIISLISNEALQRNYASVDFIKEHLELKAWEAVAEAWGEISNDDKKALWVAPSKGGIFTTAERSDLKSNEFNEARKLILGETAWIKT